MTNEVLDMSTPNSSTADPAQNAVPSLDSIAAKMAAMRNQAEATKQTETGSSEKAIKEAPVAPDGVEVSDDDNTESIGPEDSDTEDYVDSSTEEDTSPSEEVSTSDSTQEDIIDFLDFAETNPNAKFKFMRNGKEVVVDAKKAAAILGQGGAIHEEARQLKIQKSEFDEYLKHKQAETEGLLLAMEFTVKPQLQKAYDEILKTQQYQTTFQQQLAQTRDPAQQARLQASIAQNERYISQQADVVRQLKPNLDQFYDIRSQQVREVLENNRKSFKDRELKNDYVFNEVRDKVAKDWTGARGQLVPGIDNIDLISSDEHIISLLRDGLKYREKPKVKGAGGSIAALTGKRSGSMSNANGRDETSTLREKAKAGDKKAADNLLVAQLQKIRASRGR
jgi:hypothetical protein